MKKQYLIAYFLLNFILTFLFQENLKAQSNTPKVHSQIVQGTLSPQIKQGTLITIADYEKFAKVFFIKLVSEESIGPFMVAHKDLISAISLDSKEIKKGEHKKPKVILGKDFYLSKDLQTLTPQEGKKRFEKFGKRSELKSQSTKN